MSSVLALEQVVLVDSFSSSSSRELSLRNPLLGAGWSSTSDISSETDLQGKKIQRSLLKGIFGCKNIYRNTCSYYLTFTLLTPEYKICMFKLFLTLVMWQKLIFYIMI